MPPLISKPLLRKGKGKRKRRNFKTKKKTIGGERSREKRMSDDKVKGWERVEREQEDKDE